MIKSKLQFTFLLVFGTLNLCAQDATTVSGGDASGTGGSAAYSVGQVSYTCLSGSSGSVSQGVQQTYTIIGAGLSDHPEIHLSMSVYPNPLVTVINLNVGAQNLKNLTYQLFDIQGKLIVQEIITSVEVSINMEGYNEGNYFLKVINSNS